MHLILFWGIKANPGFALMVTFKNSPHLRLQSLLPEMEHAHLPALIKMPCPSLISAASPAFITVVFNFGLLLWYGMVVTSRNAATSGISAFSRAVRQGSHMATHSGPSVVLIKDEQGSK